MNIIMKLQHNILPCKYFLGGLDNNLSTEKVCILIVGIRNLFKRWKLKIKDFKCIRGGEILYACGDGLAGPFYIQG